VSREPSVRESGDIRAISGPDEFIWRVRGYQKGQRGCQAAVNQERGAGSLATWALANYYSVIRKFVDAPPYPREARERLSAMRGQL